MEVSPMEQRKYMSVPQLAKILGVSRVTVYKWVKAGVIPATKVGKTYVITDKTINEILGKSVSPGAKRQIDEAVHRVVREYGRVLRRLAKE
jgi:excisionase family DNA binding protein